MSISGPVPDKALRQSHGPTSRTSPLRSLGAWNFKPDMFGLIASMQALAP
jgi:hypothetical protein